MKHALYVEATGGIGGWTADVFTVPYGPRATSHAFDSRAVQLAHLKGVRKEATGSSDAAWPMWRIDFATEATDFEHDRAHLLDIHLAAPAVIFEAGHKRLKQRVVGFGFDLRLPTQAWLDEQLASDEWCTYETCKSPDQAHRIVEYLPPERPEVDEQLGHTPLLAIELTWKGTS